MSKQSTKNYNNNDMRCGLLMEVRVNCNYIEQLYCDYNSEGSWELTFIGGDNDDEEEIMEAFWGEYNKMIVSVLEEPHKYREENGGMEQELIYRFEECLNNWKNFIIMKDLNEEEEEEEEEFMEYCCECDNKFDFRNGIQYDENNHICPKCLEKEPYKGIEDCCIECYGRPTPLKDFERERTACVC